MRASVGDRIIFIATHVDEPYRLGEILEVHGQEGQPPCLVRWSDTGHESLVFPDPDSEVHHHDVA